MSKLKFKNDEYEFNELWKLYTSKKILFSSGEVVNLDTGEYFDISNFDEYKMKYASEIYKDLKNIDEGSSLKRRLRYEANKKRLKELENLNNLFEMDIITEKEVKRLVKLKYTVKEIDDYTIYKKHIKMNLDEKILTLPDARLGLFYKISHNIFKRNNNREVKNSITLLELQELLNISTKSVYKIIQNFKTHNIMRGFKFKNTTYFFINPKYIFDGELNVFLFLLFEEDIKKTFKSIPKEIIEFWGKEVLKIKECIGVKQGVYRLYKNNKIIYIGKSINIDKRILEHCKDKDFDSYDYSIFKNYSNANIYEIYLIDKYKPILNKDCIETTTSTITLEEPLFCNIIRLGGDDVNGKR